jgi:YD repeat-containing protein
VERKGSGIDNRQIDTVRYERDRAGRVTGVIDSAAGRTEMGYDLLGRQVIQRWPNGVSETKTYDPASRLLAITPGKEDKKGPPTITYSYDSRGNRLTMNRSDVGLSTYTYDQISQLLTAALPYDGKTPAPCYLRTNHHTEVSPFINSLLILSRNGVG